MMIAKFVFEQVRVVEVLRYVTIYIMYRRRTVKNVTMMTHCGGVGGGVKHNDNDNKRAPRY